MPSSTLLNRKQTFSEKMLHYSVKLLKRWNVQQNVWMLFKVVLYCCGRAQCSSSKPKEMDRQTDATKRITSLLCG